MERRIRLAATATDDASPPRPGIWNRMAFGAPPASRPWDAAELETVGDLADLVSPALADRLFADSNGSPVGPGEAHRSRLTNRLHRVTALRWAVRAGNAGIDVLAIKGLATAHCLYPDPDLRALSDADLLVRRPDAPRLTAFLKQQGLIAGAAVERGRWGHISDASGRPMGRADDLSNVDIHLHPDAWPLHRALTTADVFAAREIVDTPEGPLPVPCLTDQLLIAISHAARDLFQPTTMKTLIDGILLLQGWPDGIDWQRFEAMARRGWLLRPARAFLAVAGELGGVGNRVPRHLRQPPRGGEFARLRRDYIDVFPEPATAFARLRREWLLAAAPQVALMRNLWRLQGLFRPRQGPVPEI